MDMLELSYCLHSVYTPQDSTPASSFLCGFAGGSTSFKSEHQQEKQKVLNPMFFTFF